MIAGITETENRAELMTRELNPTKQLTPNEEIENYIRMVPIIDETEVINNDCDEEPPSPTPLCPQYSPSLVLITQESYDKMGIKYQMYPFASSGYYYYFSLYHSEDDNIYEVCKMDLVKVFLMLKK